MTDLELLNHYIDSPDETPSLEWVERMGSDYPYLVTPKLLLLKRGKHMLRLSNTMLCSGRWR